jgi:hypothetical protein
MPKLFSFRIAAALILVAIAGTRCSAEEPRKSLRAVRAATPPVIDGHLDEAVWAQAPVASGFKVSSPELGKDPRRATEVRVLYDDQYVYIGARMHHTPGRAAIVRQLHRRDRDSASDWFGVYLDSLHDRRTAFAFMVNAAGVQQDRVVYQEFNEDSSWDGVWESAVSCDADGWTAELKIPLALLRLKDTGDGQVWGVNFLRSDYQPSQEVSLWQIVPRGVNAWVSAFPELVGIEGVRPQPRREWIPYVSAQRKFETAQPFDDRRWTRRAGLDAHLGINSYSQLDLSLRPDFGQVEVDQAVLNLGTYETFFPEKRPFFLEGMELFQFTGPQLFYSRRIGRGLGDPTLAEGETLVDRPASAEILGAGKWTSKLAGGLNLGVLAAQMESSKATVRDAEGREARRELSPMTQAAVVRATQSLDDRGSLYGGFGSYFHEAGPQGRTGVVGGADLALKSEDRGRRLEFSLVETRTGTPGNTTDGHYERVQMDRQWKNGWSLTGTLINASRDFDPNDLGYTQRPDRRMFQLDGDHAWDQPLGFLRNRRWHASYYVHADQAGKPFNEYISTWGRTEFTNGWALMAGLEKDLPVQDDRELRTGGDPVKKYLRVDGYPVVFANLDTPGGWPWSFGLRFNQAWREGGPTRYLGLTQSIRPLPQLELQADTNYTRETGELHYVETQGAQPIVGLRHLGQLDQTLSAAYAFTARFTLQLFSQWLVASWHFRDLKAYVDDRHLATGAASAQNTASDRLWNLNLIARWEFRPGSSLFVVYTHGAATEQRVSEGGQIRPFVDLAALRHQPSDDIVQLKWSCLFR